MLIECIAKVDGVVETAISNDVYAFRFDAYGRRVCEVDREEHIAAFLAVEGVYRAAEIMGQTTTNAIEEGAEEAEPSHEAAPEGGPLAGLSWDDLAALYEEKYGRKPHSRASTATLIERLTA